MVFEGTILDSNSKQLGIWLNGIMKTLFLKNIIVKINPLKQMTDLDG